MSCNKYQFIRFIFLHVFVCYTVFYKGGKEKLVLKIIKSFKICDVVEGADASVCCKVKLWNTLNILCSSASYWQTKRFSVTNQRLTHVWRPSHHLFFLERFILGHQYSQRIYSKADQQVSESMSHDTKYGKYAKQLSYLEPVLPVSSSWIYESTSESCKGARMLVFNFYLLYLFHNRNKIWI